MTLTEFLRARLHEDQERAELVKRQPYRVIDKFEPWRLSWEDEYDLLYIQPERALAEVESKRRIIDIITDVQRWDESIGEPLSTLAEAALDTLRLLAQPYADHPDFDPAWRI